MVSSPRDLHQPPPISNGLSALPCLLCRAAVWGRGAPGPLRPSPGLARSWARRGGCKRGCSPPPPPPPDLAINCRARGPQVLLWHPGLQQGGQRGGGWGSAGCWGAAGGVQGAGEVQLVHPGPAQQQQGGGGCQDPELMGGGVDCSPLGSSSEHWNPQPTQVHGTRRSARGAAHIAEPLPVLGCPTAPPRAATDEKHPPRGRFTRLRALGPAQRLGTLGTVGTLGTLAPCPPASPEGQGWSPALQSRGDAGAGGFSLPPLPPNPTYFFICPYGVGRRYGMLRSMYFWAGTPTPGPWCWRRPRPRWHLRRESASLGLVKRNQINLQLDLVPFNQLRWRTGCVLASSPRCRCPRAGGTSGVLGTRRGQPDPRSWGASGTPTALSVAASAARAVIGSLL
ncbi:collagen alpha-1(I) chain-like isoform X1 [Cygnus olor]|uniref:collagen alpha-1(I) chain-like isoform X1 n=1 Tax=Cygnus olor TaxID=8869 RepID=UPI001ADDFD41|nr:collagen alpha-1(I) chain-like isoform X1 [Cygnus olor]